METPATEHEAESAEPYLVKDLAELPPLAIVSQEALAVLLKCDRRSITNLVDRGELPPPVPLGRRKVWTAGAILKHLSDRLESELSASKSRARR